MDAEVLKVAEVAETLRLSEKTVYRKLRRGELYGFRLGSGPASWRVPRAELDRLLEHEPELAEVC